MILKKTREIVLKCYFADAYFKAEPSSEYITHILL